MITDMPGATLYTSSYSLLGSSGCGKTTLLTCIVGIRNLSCGDITVFGSRTGTRGSGIPGPRVGYMPQDIALYDLFTIQETLYYFGTLNGMKSRDIMVETGAFIEFLDLPNQSRRVGAMSGGQRRRLSLAVALVHNPELVILDEPTVGVDPLLRESIWNHLIQLVTASKVTVIITTHYIDEARHSNMIGVMREGKILTEKTPQEMYTQYETTILEDIVLKLCHEDEAGSKNIALAKTRTFEGIKAAQSQTRNNLNDAKTKVVANIDTGIVEKKLYQRTHIDSEMKSSACRIGALIKKNFTVTLRNYLFAIFLLCIPALMVPLIMTVASGKLRDLKLAVVNKETSNCQVVLANPARNPCSNIKGYSCDLLKKLPEDSIHLKSYDSIEKAEYEVREGHLHGYMHFPEGFSEAMYWKLTNDPKYKSSIVAGPLSIRVDESNPVIGPATRQAIGEAYSKLYAQLLQDCKKEPELAMLPYQFGKPIYGGYENHTREFAACGFLVGFIFFFGNVSSSVSLVWDKKQGTVERAEVSGVRTWEILFAQLITELVLVLVQTLLAFFILVVIYPTECRGSHALAILILVLCGVMGNAHGFLWAAISSEEIEVVLLSMFSYFPGHFLSGLMWPVENFPSWVQSVAYFLPTTLPSESVRSIFFRGMGLSHSQVYEGFIGVFVWITLLWTLTIIIHARIAATK